MKLLQRCAGHMTMHGSCGEQVTCCQYVTCQWLRNRTQCAWHLAAYLLWYALVIGLNMPHTCPLQAHFKGTGLESVYGDTILYVMQKLIVDLEDGKIQQLGEQAVPKEARFQALPYINVVRRSCNALCKSHCVSATSPADACLDVVELINHSLLMLTCSGHEFFPRKTSPLNLVYMSTVYLTEALRALELQLFDHEPRFLERKEAQTRAHEAQEQKINHQVHQVGAFARGVSSSWTLARSGLR